VLQPLIRGEDLAREEARSALGEILAGRVDGVLIASFLTALTCKGETVAEMTGFVDAMLEAATTLDVRADAIDIVGTGGDQLHTVNVSTMAALAVAGCGVPVAKHGNRAASSSVGSADVLEALGVRLDVSPATITASLEDAHIAFLFAPTYHHALGYLTPIRRALSFRTIFNVLGPLANPARVRRSLIGVAQSHLVDAMAAVMHAHDVEHVVLVHGHDGLDELSLGAVSTLHTVTGDGVSIREIDAGTLLGRRHDVSAIRGGDTKDNVTIVRRFLDGHEGPVMDVVCANAALALMVAGHATSLEEGFAQAHASVVDGRAGTALERLVAVSNS
jgi:anthranilate phosphoribosyltransferase